MLARVKRAGNYIRVKPVPNEKYWVMEKDKAPILINEDEIVLILSRELFSRYWEKPDRSRCACLYNEKYVAIMDTDLEIC